MSVTKNHFFFFLILDPNSFCLSLEILNLSVGVIEDTLYALWRTLIVVFMFVLGHWRRPWEQGLTHMMVDIPFIYYYFFISKLKIFFLKKRRKIEISISGSISIQYNEIQVVTADPYFLGLRTYTKKSNTTKKIKVTSNL